MAKTLSAAMVNGDEEEDYIDMEVSSSSTFFCYSIGSPPQQVSRDFEFQMPSSTSLECETTLISPADELFYKGNLLPLHIPPRLQMVENLFETSTTSHENKAKSFSENYTSSTTTSSTTFDSCNVSPIHSYTVSKELNAANEYFYECPTDEVIGFIDENPKKSWSKKLNLIKQSSLGMKLKSSGAYFKSLFSKSGCSNESCFETNRKNGVEGIASKGKECLKKYIKVGNNKSQIDRYKVTGNVMKAGIGREKMSEANGHSHRKSFSNANSKDIFELHLLRRIKSDNSEIESAVQGAIAHCKQSPVVVLIKKDRK
ncbi:hypothetical protein MKX03_030237 [Papaver bracteatum]|nr:hypothetical protein MKX03_030237 [Papaver bracteatum]